ncbi:MAG: bifunctional demethylmenaquinone methyltransferase/2-methoxy-6-polyprenyl-1,4-benzoquinol methylase UbiE [Bacteroidales bacterium]|nr:bifunctional demethylmenaquinone methyltransferase/2-methoxy-6-polyprenyl-1,4-benzoquinol methylase UbiE [Bacteroidales bacterium]
MAKKEKMEAMFDSIAADYDSLNHIMSMNVDKLWRRRAANLIKQHCAEKGASKGATAEVEVEVLDLACGTGDFAIEMGQNLDQNCHITGLDLSEGMLKVMREKVAKAGLEGRIETQKGEGESLPFPDGSFDVVSISFGIRNFEDRPQSLREALRVLKKGGIIVILELSVPTNPLIRWCYNVYFTKIMPVLGGKISGDRAAYNYLPASVLAFPGKTEWMATMESCGFSNVTHKALSLGICRLYTGTKSSHAPDTRP